MRRLDRGWRAFGSCIALWTLLLSGCDGSGGVSSGVGSSGSGTPAVNASTDTGPTSADIDDRSGDLLLTRLGVTLKSDATQEQLDAAMAAAGSTGIGFSRSVSPYLTLIVPRQQSGAALASLVNRLSSARNCARPEATVVLVDNFQTWPDDPNNQLGPLLGDQAHGAFDQREDVAGTAVSGIDKASQAA